MKYLFIFLAIVVGMAVLGLFFIYQSSVKISPPDTQFPAVSTFSDGFESVNTIDDLIAKDGTRWYGFQQQSNNISISLERNIVHEGKQSIKFTAGAYSGQLPKADIERSSLSFKKGDEVWFSGWYYLISGSAEQHPIFFWDLEASKTGSGSPGRRLYLSGSDWIASDLGKFYRVPIFNWFGAPTFRQDRKTAIPFPKDSWVQIKVHLYVSDGNDGKMEVWQNGVKIIDGNGQTLPTADSAYDRLQVGITSNSDPQNAQTLYVDDIKISNKAF